MFKITKRALAWCLALVLILSAFPMVVFAEETEENSEMTLVQTTLDFTKMQRVTPGRKPENDKAKVRDILLAAGAVECVDLFLAGNFENIINPTGYSEGYYIQKLTAADGESLQNAYLEFGYWICGFDVSMEGAQQGYIQVYVSADNENYELVWECDESNGPAFGNSRRTASIELPVAEGQTEIYVKFFMAHWTTYEGAGIAYSTITGNLLEHVVETDKKPHELTMVTASHNFNSLAQGEVTAEDIGAVDEQDMFFGIDGVLLLSPKDGYKIASATWMLEAAEGEPLNDCVLTIVGRTFWGSVEEQKQNHYLKVYASADGVNFTMVQEFRGTENEDDTQRFVVDLTSVVQGYGQAYVKLEWMLYDSPHIFGIRSVTLVGNTAGIDPNGGGSTRVVVSNVQSFTSLPVGTVDKTDIDAFKSANLMFGYNKTPLLTTKKAGLDAYATWKLNAVEGEPFVDCYLTLIGKFTYMDEAKKEESEIRVYLSVDGETFNEVKTILPTEDQSDAQKIVIDLSAQTYGLTEFYLKIYWKSKDDPSAMGLRSMSLVANAGKDYELFTPELEDRVITDEEMPQEPTVPTQPSEPSAQPAGSETTAPTAATQPAASEPQQGNDWLIWCGIAAAVIAVAIVVIVVSKKKAK